MNEEPRREEKEEEKITPEDLTFRSRRERSTEEPAEKTEFQKKAENFFYYHKWKVIAAAFVIFVVIVCSVQMKNKVEPDAVLVYAGGKNVNKISQNGDISEYQKLISALKPYAADTNGDGKIAVSLETLFVLSEEEKREVKASLEEGMSLNETQLSENATTLSESLLLGDTFVYLLSESSYEANRALFLPLAAYAPASLGEECYYDECAIRLSAIPAGEKPGLSLLPEDTLLCLRRRNEGLGNFGKAKSEKNFNASCELVRALLAEGQ